MKRNLFYALTLALSAACMLLASYLWWDPPLLAALLAANAALLIWIGARPKHDLLLFVLAGLLGAGAESYAISRYAWSYTLPWKAGIPYWLILVWGTAGIFLARLSDAIKENLKI